MKRSRERSDNKWRREAEEEMVTRLLEGFPSDMYVGTILVGGSQWSLLSSVASDIFGIGHLVTIAMTTGIASPIG
ncbi:hypothetical protein Q3G72_021760 [Acer saccharum]|nr:hypothetical protein Q3G72_021760 [Acer saccharum]